MTALSALIDKHGVAGLARRVGVADRTVFRWKGALSDPSPLARRILESISDDEPSNKKQGPDGRPFRRKEQPASPSRDSSESIDKGEHLASSPVRMGV